LGKRGASVQELSSSAVKPKKEQTDDSGWQNAIYWGDLLTEV
jgi:hypothetical protein